MFKFFTYPKDYYSSYYYDWFYWLLNTNIVTKYRSEVLKALRVTNPQELILDHHFKLGKPIANFYKNLGIAKQLKRFFRRVYIVCPDVPDLQIETSNVSFPLKYEGTPPIDNVEFTLENYFLCRRYTSKFNILPVIQFNFSGDLEYQLIKQLEVISEKYVGVGSLCKFASSKRHFKLFNMVLRLLREYASDRKIHFFGLSLSILKRFLGKMLRWDLLYSFDSNAYVLNKNYPLRRYRELIFELVKSLSF